MTPLLSKPLGLGVPAALALAFVFITLQGCAAGDPHLSGAERQLQAGEYQQAVEHADQALAANPDNVQAHLIRAEAYRALARRAATDADRQRHAESAAADFARVRALGATDGRTTFTLLTSFSEELNHGAQAFQRGAENPQAYREAASSFRVAAAIMPDSAQAHLGRGISLLGAGDTDAAAEPLRRAIDLGTNVPEAYVYLGRIYLADDRADDAIAVLERGRDRFPDNPEIQTELLNTYARTGQADRAISAYARAVAENPDDPTLRYNYGSFLLQAERYDEAVEHLTRAAELDPQSGNAFYNLGAAYINQAVAVNERMADLDPAGADHDRLRTERDALLRRSVEPLERARTLLAAEGQNVQGVCQSLFRAYAQLRMDAEARAAAECAGIDLD